MLVVVAGEPSVDDGNNWVTCESVLLLFEVAVDSIVLWAKLFTDVATASIFVLSSLTIVCPDPMEWVAVVELIASFALAAKPWVLDRISLSMFVVEVGGDDASLV